MNLNGTHEYCACTFVYAEEFMPLVLLLLQGKYCKLSSKFENWWHKVRSLCLAQAQGSTSFKRGYLRNGTTLLGIKFSACARLKIHEFHLNIPVCKLFCDFSAEGINQSYFLILIPAGVIGNILSFLVIKGTFNESVNLIEKSLIHYLWLTELHVVGCSMYSACAFKLKGNIIIFYVRLWFSVTIVTCPSLSTSVCLQLRTL